MDMSVDGGLVFTDSTNGFHNASEVLAIDQAQKFGAKAVYFRRILRTAASADEEVYTSLPQLYIYDEDFDDTKLVDIHRNLWSSGVVPFFYVVTSSQVKIFSCTRKAEQVGNVLKVNPFKQLSLASDILGNYSKDKFSAKLFDNGSFWEQDEYADLLNPKNGPYETLLEGLLKAKENLSHKANKQKISEQTITKLLIMCILVKYLEEKTGDDGVKLFSIDRDFLSMFGKNLVFIEKFTDVLRNGQAVDFFEKLSAKFSGEVFQFSNEEKNELQETDLNFIANIFDAKMTGSGQYVIWELYSFNYLPIELISGIYEAFLNHDPKYKRSKGVVYTPPYLVNFLIDECMPLEKAENYFGQEDFKVLDPACGSGIFLVSAFKRMIQWKAVINHRSTGEIKYPDLETVRRIVRNNIFGVDVEHEATRLTIFSLCIAICEKLSPMQIWRDLQFDDLNQNNIRTNNFFAYFKDNDVDGLKRQSFDLVIGNPPFNPPNGVKNKDYFEQLIRDYPVQPSAPIHDNNLAIHFLDRCMRFPKQGKSTCLILPSGAWLYNNNSAEYRKHFIEAHTVNKIIDFTHLSDVLFYGRADVAVCAVITENATPVAKSPILHTVVHRAKVAEKRYFFEIDHYDFNSVRYQTALNSPFVWKANLLGGGRLLRLVERLSRLENVGDFLRRKEDNNGWVVGEGYKIGHDGTKSGEELAYLGYDSADWITGHKTLRTESFTDESDCEYSIEKEVFFERPRKKELFMAPHVLIKENLGKNSIPILYSEEYLCFKDQVIGIHAPNEQREGLYNFYEKFCRNNNTYRFYLTSISSKAGITMSPSVLVKNDIMSLPYPDNEEDLLLSPSEENIRDDVSKYLINLGKTTASSPLYVPVEDTEIVNFGKAFCQAMNPIYENYGQIWQVDSFIKNNTFIGYAFCFGKPKSESVVDWQLDSEQSVYNLIYNQTRRNVRIYRVIREYFHISGYDILILIKPNMLRYWLKSVALRDTDETFADLKRAGF